MKLRSRFAVVLLAAALLLPTQGCRFLFGEKPGTQTDTPPQTSVAPAPDPPPPPALDGQALAARIAEASPTRIKTIRVSARTVAEGREVEGKKIFSSTLVAELSGRLRFRASREPLGELFQLLQDGDQLSVYLPREKLLFVGPLEDLNESAGLLKRLHPLWMLRGLVVRDHLAQFGGLLTWTRLDANTIQAEGPTGFPDLPWGRYIIHEETLDPLRVYLYPGIPGLGGNPDDVDVSVVYSGWIDQDGARLPAEATVSLPREHLRLMISEPLTGGMYLVNPKLTDVQMTIKPAAGVETYPLAQMVFTDETEEAAEDTN
jgi:hypothetical protein